MMFGPGGGGFGPGGAQTSAAAGLPFAGVPAELREQADAILATEPVHPEPAVRYDPIGDESRPFTLRSFLGGHRWQTGDPNGRCQQVGNQGGVHASSLMALYSGV